MNDIFDIFTTEIFDFEFSTSLIQILKRLYTRRLNIKDFSNIETVIEESDLLFISTIVSIEINLEISINSINRLFKKYIFKQK